MGKLILCSGARTTRPYGFTGTGDKVYSIEELCYYLYQHPLLIEEEIVSDALIDWIGTELKLTQRSEKLHQLKRQKADVKTMVTVVLCSADYYTEYEIKSFLRTLDEIIGMPGIKRSCIKADTYLANRQYREAAAEYEKIFATQEAAALPPEEYGDLLHNLAVVKLHTSGPKEAEQLFGQAYERNRREESLCQYLYTLYLSGDEEIYLQKLEDYQVGEALRQKVEDFLEAESEKVRYTEQIAALENLRRLKGNGQISEFYQKAGDMLYDWKLRVRHC